MEITKKAVHTCERCKKGINGNNYRRYTESVLNKAARLFKEQFTEVVKMELLKVGDRVNVTSTFSNVTVYNAIILEDRGYAFKIGVDRNTKSPDFYCSFGCGGILYKYNKDNDSGYKFEKV